MLCSTPTACRCHTPGVPLLPSTPLICAPPPPVSSDKPELRPLAYPLVQLLLGAARLVPTPRFFPLRLRMLRACARLTAAQVCARGCMLCLLCEGCVAVWGRLVRGNGRPAFVSSQQLGAWSNMLHTPRAAG